jgi:hypothetical protein
MKHPIRNSFAVLAMMAAAPAGADIIDASSSDSQGTLVHGNGGSADVGLDITGTLGAGPSAPEIVHFTGDTTDTGSSNELMIQGGAGQAEITGATSTGNDTFDLVSGNIFLSGNAGMDWIEMAFGDVTGGTITFTLSALDSLGNPESIAPFMYSLDPNGENKFAFEALNGESITNLAWSITGGTAGDIRQVRIASTEAGVPPVPEPATWGMMLLGFAGVGMALRRKRPTLLSQIA